MAVTITGSPDAISALYNPFKFTLNIDDIGNGDTVKKIGYKLLDSADNVIVSHSQVERKSIGEEPLDFSQDLIGYIYSIHPGLDLTAGVILSVVDFSIQVKLVYGDVVINNVTGVVVDNVVTESSLFTVFHSALQRNENTYLNEALQRFALDHRPLSMELASRAVEWLFFYNGAATSADGFEWEVFYCDATSNVVPGTLNNGLKAISLTPGEASFSVGKTWDDVLRITAKITDVDFPSPGYIMYTSVYRKWNSRFHEIMFLDPLGGRPTISFEEHDGSDISSAFDEITRQDCQFDIASVGNDIMTPMVMNGAMILNKSASENISLVIDSAYSIEIADYYKMFLASAGYQIVKRDANGNPFEVHKFILAAGSIRYYKEYNQIRMTVSGKIAHPINVHSIDR